MREIILPFKDVIPWQLNKRARMSVKYEKCLLWVWFEIIIDKLYIYGLKSCDHMHFMRSISLNLGKHQFNIPKNTQSQQNYSSHIEVKTEAKNEAHLLPCN